MLAVGVISLFLGSSSEEATAKTEETAAEPIVEEAPVVEKPKRGRKKAVPLTGVSELNDQAAETPVVEEPIEKSVTEDEIGDILNNILNIEE